MIIFVIQKDQFNDWCVSKSQTDTVKTITINNSTTHTIGDFDSTNITGLVFIPLEQGSDLYNCTRLWEDEMKFAIVIFAILFTLYVNAYNL